MHNIPYPQAGRRDGEFTCYQPLGAPSNSAFKWVDLARTLAVFSIGVAPFVAFVIYLVN